MSKDDDVFWRQFGAMLILLTAFGFAMYFTANAIGGQAYANMNYDPDEIVARIAPVGQSRIGDPAAQAEAPAQPAATAAAATAEQAATTESTTEQAAATDAAQTSESAPVQTAAASSGGAVDVAAGEKVYRSACFACHLSGVAGAPKLDDQAAWEPRLGQGMTGLLQSVTNGKGAMPPKGGFAHLTVDEIRNAIGFMLNQAGLSVEG